MYCSGRRVAGLKAFAVVHTDLHQASFPDTIYSELPRASAMSFRNMHVCFTLGDIFNTCKALEEFCAQADGGRFALEDRIRCLADHGSILQPFNQLLGGLARR